MVDEVVGTISGAMLSERARDLVGQNVFQVRRLLKREDETMFASIEQESATVHTCRPPHQDERVHAEPKRPPSAFFLFSSKARSELPQGQKHCVLANRLSAQRDQMGAERRQVYEDEASKLNAAYEKQVQDYRQLGFYYSPG